MRKEYRLADETIEKHEIEELRTWLAGNPWLTQGPKVKELEAAWARWIVIPHATFVNSGSSANLLMVAAPLYDGRLKNKKVIVPAVSWPTTVMPVMQLGLDPILCDADPQTFGLDIGLLSKLCAEHDPAAVILVHVLGVPCRMDEILSLQRKHGFLLMEDSCAALGSRYDGKQVGSFGDFSTYSFFYGHQLSTVEGGMVCSRDARMNEVLRMVRAHGWSKDIEPERAEARAKEAGALEFNKPFTFHYPGFNVRGTDLQAVIGLAQMRKADRVVARRVENHRVYMDRFRGKDGFAIQENPRGEICSISFAALASSTAHRATVAAALREKNIETRPIGGGNMSRQPFWKNRYGSQVFPMADRIHETGMQLPNHPVLTVEDIHFICDVALAASR